MTEEELSRKVDEIAAKMTKEEKIAFCSGKDFWHTKEVAGCEVPEMMMTDGPNGLRKQNGKPDALGAEGSEEATCFPTAVTAAQTWNRKLLYEEGRAIGEEAKEAKVGVVLGPGVNIKRNPLCGRNFEYYSEDPYVAGELGASFVAGMQNETGIGASLKHFACNSQEYRRLQSDSQIDERTLREIYLRAFEKVVKKAQPATVMCAYNQINGTFCSDSKKLLTDILRKEWGFKGAVITDWGALHNRTEAFRAGCDLVMPGGSSMGEKEAGKALDQGKLDIECVNASVKRLLTLVLRRSEALEKAKDYSYDRTAHQMTAQRIAEEGAVLLKNDGAILPLENTGEVVLIGRMAVSMRYQGGGSSHINPTKLTQVRECIPDAAYVEGCDEEGNVTEESLEEVTRAAKRARKAVVFVGLTDRYESEGFDRRDLSIPVGHNRMVKAALAGNPNVIVVLMGGSPMKLPWRNEVKAILYTGLCGQAGGTAIANLLTGKVNPSGKLTETWPLEEIDIPSYGRYGKKNAQYREGIYVGYRYYEKAGQPVAYPFGYGLSYTKFEYTNLLISDRQVTVQVRNVGNRAGSEVVQLYMANPQDGTYRPLKELRAFEKVFLQPGEGAMVTFLLASRDFAIYQDGWRIPTGTYAVLVGSSSADIRLSQQVIVEEEKVPAPAWLAGSWYAKPAGQPSIGEWRHIMENLPAEAKDAEPGSFSEESSISEMAPCSRICRMVYHGMKKACMKQSGCPEWNEDDPVYRMSLSTSADIPVRALKSFAPGIPAFALKMLVWFANHGKNQASSPSRFLRQ